MTSLIPHPEILRRRERIGRLRSELADLVGEYIRLTFDEIPALRHRYDELFGALERSIQQKTMERTRLRRMVELFALKLDRGQKLDAKMVELVIRAVNGEQSELRRRVDRRTGIVGSGAGRLDASTNNDYSHRARSAEIRRLYRQLARRLHPDARRDHNDLSRQYWGLLQLAASRDDLELLRTLAHLVAEMGSERTAGSIQLLESEERRLERAIADEQRRVHALKGAEPYILRDDLDDDAWRTRHRVSLEREIETIDEEIAKCNRFIEPIIASVEGADTSGTVDSVWSSFVESMYFNNR